MNQSSWIYRFEAIAFCHILCNAVVKDKAILASVLSAATPAYSIWAVTSLLPPLYDYAGAHNAVNPPLVNYSGPRILFSRQNLLFNNLQSLQEEFARKPSTAFGTVIISSIFLLYKSASIW